MYPGGFATVTASTTEVSTAAVPDFVDSLDLTTLSLLDLHRLKERVNEAIYDKERGR